MTQPLVFVGYDPSDEKEKNQLLTQLRAVRGITVWSDDQIGLGANWEVEIEQAIGRAKVAVLLITASFLGSDFILERIVPLILKRQAEEGLVVAPVIAKHCVWQATDWLTTMQVRPASKRPVWGEGGSHVDKNLTTIVAEIIATVTGKQAAGKETEAKFSTEEKELLIAAAKDGVFHRISVQEIPGYWIRTGVENFVDENDPVYAAKYLEAFDDLCQRGMISHNDGLFKLTVSGFEKAREFAEKSAKRERPEVQTGAKPMTDETNIGGVNISGVSGGTITVQGDIDAGVTAGQDVVAGNKTEYHYHIYGPGQGDLPGTPHEVKPALEEKPHLKFEPKTILIPTGPFWMGVDTEGPWKQHHLTLPAYKIGKYPLTNSEYAKFVKQHPEQAPERGSGWRGLNPPAKKLEHPVVCVSWDNALAYCRWLSRQTGRNYRLLTEAEWEKAARGAKDRRLYPWGDELNNEYCNYNNPKTTPVDYYKPGKSPYGCYDMVGNVWEWTVTLWGSRPTKADFSYPYQNDGREKLDVTPPAFRIYRGGAYNESQNQVGCSQREYYAPDAYDRNLGFRVALDV